MAKESQALIKWKLKLREVVELARELECGDHAAALQFWGRALHLIQSSWRATSVHLQKDTIPLQDENQVSMKISSLHYEGGVTENSYQASPALTPSQEPSLQQDTGEVSAEVREDRGCGMPVTVQPSSQNVQQEQEDIIGTAGPSQVRSVHLMISADPDLVAVMNKLRKSSKQEDNSKREMQYQCDKCPKQCRTPLALSKHRSTHSKDLVCSFCDRTFANHHDLKAHKKTHMGQKPYECTKCSCSFTTRGNLVRHAATHQGHKPWLCTQCGKRYQQKKSLNIHLRTHTGEKPYECNVCHKRFSQSGILQSHQLIHTNQFAHLCDVCGRSFRQRAQLVTHHLRHQGIRPHACTQCDRRFTSKGDMERHVRTHSGRKPHHCDICGSSFARPHTLQEHKNRHNNIKPYGCKICGKNFHELSACSRHIKSLHGKGEEKAPASSYILQGTKSNENRSTDKESLLLPPTSDEGENRALIRVSTEMLEDREEQQEEAEGEGDHHIYVMHTSHTEETELITIAETTEFPDKCIF